MENELEVLTVEAETARLIAEDPGLQDYYTRTAALALHLTLTGGDLDQIEDTYQENLFQAEGEEWLVLTDDEADQLCSDQIKETIWAFKSSFLEGYVPEGVDADTLRIIQEKCEDANPALLRLIGSNLDQLIEDAMGCDGRGHFLSGYDGDEYEQEFAGQTWFLYRLN